MTRQNGIPKTDPFGKSTKCDAMYKVCRENRNIHILGVAIHVGDEADHFQEQRQSSSGGLGRGT